jgi:type I restriction-modification system DNA methylase subunit
MAVDERTFVTKVASWIDAILARRDDLPYGEARAEEHVVGGQKRLDLKVLRRVSGRVVLTGEVKMPDKPYGKNVFGGELVGDAFEKASRLGSPYYFTWNVNEFALFRTHQDNVEFTERVVEKFDVTKVGDSDDVWRESVQEEVQGFWERLLEKLDRLERGIEELRNLPLDERFIRRLEGALEEPVAATLSELERSYREDKQFRTALEAWMRDEQGWEIVVKAEAMRGNLERAARLSCYAVANRLVFYEVMRRRFSELLPLATVGTWRKGQELHAALESRLRDAVTASRDYETIFEARDFGSGLPFLSDEAVPAWLRLISEIEEFDFTKLNYDVIGRMYEQLIGPGERRKYGQFFTSPDVVDLINAFCVRTGDTRVLDPACGGGTFLVRAYARKRALATQEGRERSHQELLQELFGVDVASFPAQLATINLAVRRLGDEANYPQVVRSDFFKVRPNVAVGRLPVAAGQPQERDVVVANLDAVVGNPPYVRQEELNKEYKEQLQALVGEEYRGVANPRLSGRSDLYVYFFPHGAALLKDSGYVGLVTSVGWLDTEYGFRLQGFLLSNFRVIAVIESLVEKWFEDARVTTVVTILQKESDDGKRKANKVRFIQLRRPLREIFSFALKGPVSEESESARQADLTAIRQLIEGITESEANEYWRVRVMSQGELWRRGCEAKVRPEDTEEVGEEYRAGKWGQYLRAPDVYFDLLDRCGDRLVPLDEIAEVKRGFTSGVDRFFCVRDVTEDELKRAGNAEEFRAKWAIGPGDTEKIRIIRDGEGGLHVVEARYLEPEFHRLTEATRIVVAARDVKKRVINAPVARVGLRGTRLARYVAYGEGKGWHSGSTVASRAKARPWYDLGLLPKGERAQMFWPLAHQYRHLVPWNEDAMPCNHRLFDVWARGCREPRVLWAILNSTFVALSKHQFGRPVGIEGNLDTEVIDAKMMLVPDPRAASPDVAKRIVEAAEAVSKRSVARTLPDEFGLEDRQRLDDAVLELLGVEDEEERKGLRARIYAAMQELYQATRERELVAQRDRARAKRKGRVTAADLADDIWLEEGERLRLMEFPDDFVRGWSRATVFDLGGGEVEVGEALMETGKHLRAGTIRVGGKGGTEHDVGSVGKARFIEAAAMSGRYGPIRVPVEEECEAAVREFGRYCGELRARFQELAAQRTRDGKKHKAIVEALMRRALGWRRETVEG